MTDVVELDAAESAAMFDQLCRRAMGLSGLEFLARWDRGDYTGVDVDDVEGLVEVTMALPFVRDIPTVSEVQRRANAAKGLAPLLRDAAWRRDLGPNAAIVLALPDDSVQYTMDRVAANLDGDGRPVVVAMPRDDGFLLAEARVIAS